MNLLYLFIFVVGAGIVFKLLTQKPWWKNDDFNHYNDMNG